MMHVRSLVAVPLLCALTWGCHVHSPSPVRPSSGLIVGSGRVVTESRPVSGFSAISASLAARVVFVQSGVESLSVTAEDNILPLVRTEVVAGRLVLDLASGSGISTTRGIVIEISGRTLSAIDADGAVRVELTGLQADAISLRVSGASQVTASGSARDVLLDLSGDVRCQLDGLSSRSAVVHASGTSYARLRVANSLAANVSGISVVEYYGDPVLIADVSGLSAVRHLGS
jgi:hypothetical protein